MKAFFTIRCWLILGVFLIASCGSVQDAAPPTANPPAPAATHTPTATLAPTPSLTPTPTETPTPTPTPTHPLMIEVMRQQIYPGSKVTLEEELDPGSNYDRYIASYQSEGLKIYALLTVPCN